MEEDADEAGGDGGVVVRVGIDDLAHGALGIGARPVVEPYLQPTHDLRVDGDTMPGRPCRGHDESGHNEKRDPRHGWCDFLRRTTHRRVHGA
jgi:hypothetical protein